MFTSGVTRTHRRCWRQLVPLLLVLTLASCAGSDLTPVGTPSPDPLTAPATARTSTPGALVLQPQPAVIVTAPPQPGVAGLTSVPWTAQVISADGRQVTIGYPSAAGCMGVRGVQVTQSSTSVQLTVWGLTGGGFACTTQIQYASVVVTVDPPLRRRALLHAPVSRRWATSPS